MNEQQTASVVELGPDYRIKLPEEVARRFRPTDRFVVWPQGDTVILKRITVPQVTEAAAATPSDDDRLSLEELSVIVHEVRRQRRQE